MGGEEKIKLQPHAHSLKYVEKMLGKARVKRIKRTGERIEEESSPERSSPGRSPDRRSPDARSPNVHVGSAFALQEDEAKLAQEGLI